MEPRESTTQSRSPASETVDRDGASESTHTCIPLNSSDSPDEWKFNTVGDLLENKHMYKSVKSILKSIIKKIFLQTHPDKVSDPILNHAFLKTKKWVRKKQFYKLLFVCKILSINIPYAKLQQLQPYFVNEVQLCAQVLQL